MEEAYRRINRATRDRAEIAAEAGLPELDRRTSGILDAANEDDVEGAGALLQPLIAAEPRWADAVRWLARHGSIPDDEALLAAARPQT